jgi:hypothetical protein
MTSNGGSGADGEHANVQINRCISIPLVRCHQSPSATSRRARDVGRACAGVRGGRICCDVAGRYRDPGPVAYSWWTGSWWTGASRRDIPRMAEVAKELRNLALVVSDHSKTLRKAAEACGTIQPSSIYRHAGRLFANHPVFHTWRNRAGNYSLGTMLQSECDSSRSVRNDRCPTSLIPRCGD